MLKGVFKCFAGRHYKKFLRECAPIVRRINELDNEYMNLSTDLLKLHTARFRERYQGGESLDNLLPEAFATVKNAARRLVGTKVIVCEQEFVWDMVHYDVQLIGGIALHKNYIAEMATGEGKTLVATLPLYLNALSGKNCQLVTVNDYLARRDSQWMGALFEFLGMTVGCIQHDMRPADRYVAYRSDITYGTASEFGFDYLRDNGMAFRKDDQVQRDHYYCIVDEVDSVLVDEARTPLIISGMSDSSSEESYMRLKPGIQRIVRLQNDLCAELIESAKPFLASTKDDDIELGLEKLYQVKSGMPKNRNLLRMIENGKLRRKFDKFETQMAADFNRDRAYTLREALYFTIDERHNQSDLTEKGRNTLQPNDPDAFTMPDLPTILSELDARDDLSQMQKDGMRQQAEQLFCSRSESIHCISQLLRAYCLYEKDDQYVVLDGKVVIIDENTGRAMPGRRWSDGLHQAVEAKEGVALEKESKTYATITIQNYFRMYEKLAGMTGTAETEAQEFYDIYRLKVMVVPTHRACVRKDDNDVVYKTKRSKYRFVLKDIESAHKTGQPVLVGTASVESSEVLSKMLKNLKIPHNVLNAKYHQQEAEIVSLAGQKNAVTIATNMAGRGTDIKLGSGVSELGGLLVLGTERHESRRIDRQLRGRCSRQGDPGRSKFFVSLEDDLMRLFANAGPIGAFLEKSMGEDEELTHPLLNRSIESAQKKVEQHNYSIRKRLLQYDDVLNKQREIIYSLRNEALWSDDPLSLAFDLIEDEMDEKLDVLVFNKNNPNTLDGLNSFVSWLNMQFPVFLKVDDCKNFSKDDLKKFLAEKISSAYKIKRDTEGEETAKELERFVVVSSIDKNWQDHLTEMEDLRQSVGLRGYGQKDPLNEYKSEAYTFFEVMMSNVRQNVCYYLFRASMNFDKVEKSFQNVSASGPTTEPVDNIQMPKPVKNITPKVGRNDQCPCGSGKKYKKCCGIDAE